MKLSEVGMFLLRTPLVVEMAKEYENANNNDNLQSFYDRCAIEGGSEPLRLRCSLCCAGTQKLTLLDYKKYLRGPLESVASLEDRQEEFQ